jgi:3-oxoacyl-[acyl-carrier-protein] synthase III
LGLRTDCGALDFNLGCSGYVYGLALAKGLIENGLCRNVLLITADTYTKLIHPKDRSVRTLFGDGAAATLISGVSDIEVIGPFVFGTDGRGATKLIVPAGGSRIPLNPETATVRDDGTGNFRSMQNLFMDGPEIFNFTLKVVPSLVKQLLTKAQLDLEEVDYFVFHQANRFMLEQLRKKLKIPEEKFCINMESYGNTVSATIPMALEIAYGQEQIKQGDIVMLVGFGVGYSWGAAMIKML